MRFPSKVTSYQDSILSKFDIVMSQIEKKDIKPALLYKKLKNKVSDPGEFIEILDTDNRSSNELREETDVKSKVEYILDRLHMTTIDVDGI